MTQTEKTRTLAMNGIVAAIYVALCIVVAPVASGAIQFRVAEGLNHLVVFNKKLMWGVLAGVIIFNALYSTLPDIIFGGGQTFLALGATALISKYVKDVKMRMVWNTVFFTVSMFMIAWMLNITFDLPFWPTYGTTALSELIIMTISAPVMYLVGKKVKLN
ncbi:QueT transporter family protein [Vagococcus coleopterorum]|uniref:QueT transporter family protein n=1 Tax=Vagococcus coleopterorum TaxID=2714946 RepID=A0A6G8AL66_9ENTE|nr:QueT transporter family protein [Vagococcus coleopterorum]QIL45720.1 QueT transporter family protein [Vagococcus coleopterorum]